MAIKIRIVSDFDAKGITKANQALNDMGKAAGVALAAVGVAMVGIAAKSVQEFGKFDAALVKSKAIMGDLTETMEKDMSNAAREVAKVTTFSAEQAAESYFFLASAGLDAESSIKALPQVAQFAQAGMFDMARATDLLTDAQSALGLTIRDDAVANMKNMIQVSDVLVRANTLANASVEQFSIALTTKAGAALRALGKDVEEGVAVLAAFADQGIKGEIAGTQLSIVLRDLTTKAINNKDAFDKMGIAVFDSNGEMNNLGGIIGDLEVALAGMSDETQKATLLQLGFSDKSLASLQALLGTSEAIKTYEKELRSASGFTENVATKQLDTFESQMKLLESAFIDVAIQIGQELTPYLQDLIPVIQRLLPEIGDKLTAAVKQVDWEKLASDVADFITNFVDNIDSIVKVAQAIGILAAGLVAYTTVAKIAIAHTAIMNSTFLANPYVLAAVALAGFTAVLAANNFELEENNNNYKQLQSQTDKTNYSQKNLADTYKESAWAAERYGIETDDLRDANLKLAGAADMVSGEITRFNNLRLDGIKGQIRGVDQAIIDMYHSGVAATAVFEGVIDPRTGKGLDFNIPTSTGGGGSAGDGVGGGGVSAFETARKRVQDLIKSSQKQLADSQKLLIRSQANARQEYAANILKIEKEFSDKLQGIISQSQNRLRSAYATAVGVNIASMFEEQETKSVDALVGSLRDRLTKSRALLESAGLLASDGFSQTFIEQIVAAGVEAGGELANAIISSTPEVQAELKDLFNALERESSSGMDSLANQIFQDQGLATNELKMLFANTQVELNNAMLDEQKQLQAALNDANNTFIEAVGEIKTTLTDQISDMDGQFGGLGTTIDTFIGKLDALILKYGELKTASETVPDVAPPTISFQPDMPSGGISFMPMDPGVSTGSMPAPTVDMFPKMPLQQGPGLGGNTFITINAKADSSQSLAMVGKSLGNTVAKYVTGGGQVIVSNV